MRENSPLDYSSTRIRLLDYIGAVEGDALPSVFPIVARRGTRRAEKGDKSNGIKLGAGC